MSWPSLNRGDLAAIAAGGIVGATARWLITRSQVDWFVRAPNPGDLVFDGRPAIPGSTLLANLIGCLLLGGLTVLLTRPMATRQRRVLIGAATGFCGSLTTFSAFAVEAASLLQGGRPSVGSASWTIGVDYIVLSLAGGALAFWLGRFTARQLATPAGASATGGGT